MAVDATGTPTTNFSIPKFLTGADAPSGKGGNAQMDAIDTLLAKGFVIMSAKGDLVYASANNVAARLAVGSTGNVLTVSGGVPTWAAPASGSPTTNAQSGTTYTFVLGDANNIVEGSNASATTFTLPLNSSVAYPVGTSIQVIQTGAGQITLASGGTTLNSTPGLKIAAQWGTATLLKRATDTWVAFGNLSP